MARIKHIALTTKEPATVAEFYKSAFGLRELRRNNGNVFLTDGYIHVAVLKTKGEEAPDMGAHGQRLTAKGVSDAEMGDGRHANFEQKWSGPDGVVLDVSHTGWEGTH